MDSFVQVSSGTFVIPADIKRLFTWEGAAYMICRGPVTDLGDMIHPLDWPMDRVTNALGLIDADKLDKLMED